MHRPEALIERLQSHNPNFRQQAAEQLGELRIAGALEGVCAECCLSFSIPAARKCTVLRLVRIQTARCHLVEYLIRQQDVIVQKHARLTSG
jgi:hypothetical protein